MEILTYQQDVNNVLTTKCPAYDFTTLAEDVSTAADMMQFLGKEQEGITCVGLAANQVGVSRRFFLMINKDTRRVWFCADPQIERHGKDIVWAVEGCLSCPGERVSVPRWKIIDVTFVNQNGQLERHTMRGFNARVFQHELDHVNGLLIIKTPEKAEEKDVATADV